MTALVVAARALGCAAAVAAPLACLDWSRPPERVALGLGPEGFGWTSLAIAQFVFAAPLAWLTATALLAPRGLGRVLRLVAAASAGVVLAGAYGTLASFAWPVLDSAGVGLPARSVARLAVAWALQVPWWIGVAGVSRTVGVRSRIGWGGALAALAVAALPPAAYAARVVDARAKAAEADLESGRVVRARAGLEGLRDLAGLVPLAGRPWLEARDRLDAEIHAVARTAAVPLPPDAPASARLGRGFAWIQLDRPEAAADVLGPLAEADVNAALLLAALRRDQGRWTEAARLYESAIARLGPRAGVDREARSGWVAACDGLVESLRFQGRAEEAESVYLAAIDGPPEASAYLTMQLGLLRQANGRFLAARRTLLDAVRLDPGLADQVRPRLNQLSVQTPACLIGRSPSVP